MSAGAFKGRDDHRRARELEEARKAGTIPAEKDEEGNEINPHIPQYMSQAPWYLNQDAPGLKHQRNLKEKKPVAVAMDFVPRGRKLGEAATTFRKGACTNCGAMTHKAVDCVERPRKKGAKYTGKDIKADELVVDMAFDYAGKRDHWANYDASSHLDQLKQYEKEVEIRLKEKQREKMASMALKESRRESKRKERRKAKKTGDGEAEEEEEDVDTDTDADTDDDAEDDEKEKEDEQHMIGQNVGANKNQGSAKMSVRNLRIREDTAKYLLNLDVNSAYYDPKTRAMRENPLGPGQDVALGKGNDNFVRSTGDARDLAALQLYQFEAYDKGQNLHMNADPTTVELMHRQRRRTYREKKEKLASSKANKILDKYGGQEHMQEMPAELLYAQTEAYVEYDRSGSVKRGAAEKAVVRSKYEEDVFQNNHTAVWGSFFDRQTMRWGYADDHSTVRHSYGTGAAGKRARQLAAERMAAAARRVERGERPRAHNARTLRPWSARRGAAWPTLGRSRAPAPPLGAEPAAARQAAPATARGAGEPVQGRAHDDAPPRAPQASEPGAGGDGDDAAATPAPSALAGLGTSSTAPMKAMFGMGEEIAGGELDEARVREAIEKPRRAPKTAPDPPPTAAPDPPPAAARRRERRGPPPLSPRRQKRKEQSVETDDRKRKYNSQQSDEVTTEEMEAYHRMKKRDTIGDMADPMANFKDVV